MRRWLVLAVAIGIVCALFGTARAVDRNIAGSAQLDLHVVPSLGDDDDKNDPNYHEVKQIPLRGFTTEASLKLVTDITDHFSVTTKICFGCHGFELPLAHVDYRVIDELNFRAGRFSPSFGAFNLRHDPANHRLSDKPLPYDMGRMLRMREWNLGVLPSPFPDNGIEVDGTHWFGLAAQLDWAAYVVNGFRGDNNGTDLDFRASRSRDAYYSDNNSTPTVGARLALTVKLDAENDATVGASAMHGTFDPDDRLHYTIFGADLSLRLAKTTIRAEWLARRQEIGTEDPTVYRYGVPPSGGDFFLKHGAYLEIEQSLSRRVDLLGRVDGLFRQGNVVTESELSRRSSILRGTIGAAFLIERGLRVKTSAEYWHFSDGDDEGNHAAISVHLALAASF